MKDHLDLKIFVDGYLRLHHPSGIIAIYPYRHNHVKYLEAMTFINWLTSVAGQREIAQFRINGEVLFIPNAVPAK